MGKQSHQYSDSVLVNLNITTTQPYLQLDLGFKSNIYDIVLSNRISYLNFSNFTIPTRLIESSEFTKFNQLQLLQQLNSLLLYEPAIITRLGYKNIKVVSSLSYISNVEIFKAQIGISTSPPVSRLMLTVGLSVNFNIIDEFGDKTKSKYKK